MKAQKLHLLFQALGILLAVGALLTGCASPVPAASTSPATATIPTTPLFTLRPTDTPGPTPTSGPIATWTPVPTLTVPEYAEAMREAGSAMRLASRSLEHTSLILSKHITDTTMSREVLGLADGDGLIIGSTRTVLRDYRSRGLLTPALGDALTALDSADASFKNLRSGGIDLVDTMSVIQDAQIQLAQARVDFRQELLKRGVSEALANELSQ